ncbi:hypothetical protein VTO73DRAFT_11910 [Trametes versicolor]
MKKSVIRRTAPTSSRAPSKTLQPSASVRLSRERVSNGDCGELRSLTGDSGNGWAKNNELQQQTASAPRPGPERLG